jgi:chromosome segregation ATPase
VISNHAPSAPSPSSAETAELDRKLHGLLMTTLDSAGISIYKALDGMVESLADVVPDENLRYKKALEILAKQGHTLPLILQDIDKAIGALEDSSREFEATQKSQFQQSVGALHRSVEELSTRITAKQAEAAKLAEEISTLTKKRDEDAASISTAQAKIDRVGGRYSVVYQAFMREVQAQRAIVEQQLKVTP